MKIGRSKVAERSRGLPNKKTRAPRDSSQPPFWLKWADRAQNSLYVVTPWHVHVDRIWSGSATFRRTSGKIDFSAQKVNTIMFSANNKAIIYIQYMMTSIGFSFSTQTPSLHAVTCRWKSTSCRRSDVILTSLSRETSAAAACWFSRALRFILLTSLGTLRRSSLVTTSAGDHASQDTMKWIAYCARRTWRR